MGMEKKEKHIPEISRERTPGEIVAARRKQLGWTQAELEWRSGVSSKQISRIENDSVRPGFDTIDKLEKALEIPLLQLFMKYRKQLALDEKSYLSPHGTLKNFERKLAKAGISDEELKDILEEVLSQINSDDSNN